MFWLAATRAEATASAIALASLTSWLLLFIYRPRRTELEGTPHKVPRLALALAVVWVLVMGLAALTVEVEEATELMPLSTLWIACGIGLLEITVLASAYLLPRRKRPAEALTQPTDSPPPPPPVDAIPPEDARPPAWWERDALHHIAVGATVGLAAILLTAVVASVIRFEQKPEDMHVLLRTLQNGDWNYLLPVFLAAVALAPIKEELLFRVILQGALADRIGKAAIPVTAIAFAAIHGPKDGVLLLPLAFLLGLMYEYRRSYIEVVTAHATFNAMNLIAALSQ